jgi:hypothetical protein
VNVHTVPKICSTCGSRFHQIVERFDGLFFSLGVPSCWIVLWSAGALFHGRVWAGIGGIAVWLVIMLFLVEWRFGRVPPPRTFKCQCPECGCTACPPGRSDAGKELDQKWHPDLPKLQNAWDDRWPKGHP